MRRVARTPRPRQPSRPNLLRLRLPVRQQQILQQLGLLLSRVLKAPLSDGEDSGMEIPAEAARASKFLAFDAGGVHLVAVPVDYSENTRVLVEELGGRILEVEP